MRWVSGSLLFFSLASLNPVSASPIPSDGTRGRHDQPFSVMDKVIADHADNAVSTPVDYGGKIDWKMANSNVRRTLTHQEPILQLHNTQSNVPKVAERYKVTKSANTNSVKTSKPDSKSQPNYSKVTESSKNKVTKSAYGKVTKSANKVTNSVKTSKPDSKSQPNYSKATENSKNKVTKSAYGKVTKSVKTSKVAPLPKKAAPPPPKKAAPSPPKKAPAPAKPAPARKAAPPKKAAPPPTKKAAPPPPKKAPAPPKKGGKH